MGFIYSRNVCQKEVITLSELYEECTQEEARLIIREKKMGETEAERRSLPMKKLNISIQLSFHDIVFVMHDRMFSLMIVYY